MSDTPAAPLVEVHILGMPIALVARAEEHIDGLLREFALIAASRARGGDAEVPMQLLELVSELEQDAAAMAVQEQQGPLHDARRDGRESVDVVYRVPPSIADACTRLGDALDAADRFCREGRHLLSVASPPDALAFRRWYLGELVRQVEGEAPVPWPEWRRAHPDDVD